MNEFRIFFLYCLCFRGWLRGILGNCEVSKYSNHTEETNHNIWMEHFSKIESRTLQRRSETYQMLLRKKSTTSCKIFNAVLPVHAIIFILTGWDGKLNVMFFAVRNALWIFLHYYSQYVVTKINHFYILHKRQEFMCIVTPIVHVIANRRENTNKY